MLMTQLCIELSMYILEKPCFGVSLDVSIPDMHWGPRLESGCLWFLWVLQSYLSCACACVFREYYITMVKWATSTKVAVNWLSRAQNVSILTLCDATTGVCTKVWGRDESPWREAPEGAARTPLSHLGLVIVANCSDSCWSKGCNLHPRLCFDATLWGT